MENIHMEQEDMGKSQGKIYSWRAIGWCMLLFGPLVFGFMFSNNYRIFGKPQHAKRVWVGTILYTAVFIYLLTFTQLDKDVFKIITILAIGFAYALHNRAQHTQTKEYLKNGGVLQTPWKSFTIGLLSILILLAIVFTTIILGLGIHST